jgi:hypothetical protein
MRQRGIVVTCSVPRLRVGLPKSLGPHRKFTARDRRATKLYGSNQPDFSVGHRFGFDFEVGCFGTIVGCLGGFFFGFSDRSLL